MHLEPCSSQIFHPTDKSVIFLKENDAILTNDMWHVALDINTNTYEEIISTVKGDLLLVENQKKEFTPISELKEILSFEYTGTKTL